MMQVTQDRVVPMSKRRLALGMLVAALLVAMLLASSPVQAACTFTVNSTGDDGDLTPGNGECYTGVDVAVEVKGCTLRAAIQEANASSSADTINFDIPTTGVATITPASELPKITKPVTINGYSQPGAKPNTKAVGSDAVLKIELSGEDAPTEYGLVLGAANSTVKGLAINRWNNGIRIDGPNATGIKITGNFIGSDVSGTQDLGNGQGVRVFEGSNNTIGGTTAAARNIISGNNESGIFVGGAAATGNEVTGNYVGTDVSGTRALKNSLQGVFVYFAPNNTIGGTTAGARNIITGNGGDGVGIFGAGATGNRILSNSIFSNGDLGIDLNNDGVTANDTDDPDTGPNNFQNYPVLSSARKGAAGTTTIRGTLDSTANGSFRVQFFSNPSGTDEGKTLLGSEIVSTNGSGDASFVFSTKKEVRVGQNITAMATGPGGNTSEFSAARK